MFKPTLFFAKALTAAALIVLCTAPSSFAQRGRGGRSGGVRSAGIVRSGGIRGGVVRGGIGNRGFVNRGFDNRGFNNRGFNNRGFNNGGFGGGWGWPWGLGLGLYGYPYWYGGSPYGYGGYPSWYGPGYYDYYDAGSYPIYQSMPLATDQGNQTNYPPPTLVSDNTAQIDVRMPADAQLWFDGNKTSQTGAMREFTSPPLTPGQTFTYELRATWTGEGGTPITQTRTVNVQAGKRSLVDFTTPLPVPKQTNPKD